MGLIVIGEFINDGNIQKDEIRIGKWFRKPSNKQPWLCISYLCSFLGLVKLSDYVIVFCLKALLYSTAIGFLLNRPMPVK